MRSLGRSPQRGFGAAGIFSWRDTGSVGLAMLNFDVGPVSLPGIILQLHVVNSGGKAYKLRICRGAICKLRLFSHHIYQRPVILPL